MDAQIYHYATVTKALDELKSKGFTVDFNVNEERIINSPEDFTVEHIYRYEGITDPGDEATVYGIRNKDGEQGVFLSSHMTYAESDAARILHELSIKGREDRFNE
ncbi:MAG TPA: hypothetical protein VGB50_06005 [Flavobacterium sp.]|jgi:hypothetical protein